MRRGRLAAALAVVAFVGGMLWLAKSNQAVADVGHIAAIQSAEEVKVAADKAATEAIEVARKAKEKAEEIQKKAAEQIGQLAAEAAKKGDGYEALVLAAHKHFNDNKYENAQTAYRAALRVRDTPEARAGLRDSYLALGQKPPDDAAPVPHTGNLSGRGNPSVFD